MIHQNAGKTTVWTSPDLEGVRRTDRVASATPHVEERPGRDSTTNSTSQYGQHHMEQEFEH